MQCGRSDLTQSSDSVCMLREEVIDEYCSMHYLGFLEVQMHIENNEPSCSI